MKVWKRSSKSFCNNMRWYWGLLKHHAAIYVDRNYRFCVIWDRDKKIILNQYCKRRRGQKSLLNIWVKSWYCYSGCKEKLCFFFFLISVKKSCAMHSHHMFGLFISLMILWVVCQTRKSYLSTSYTIFYSAVEHT